MLPQSYNLIRKIRRHELEPATAPRQLERQLARIGLDALGGFSVASDLIKSWGLGSRKYCMMERIRKLAEGGGLMEDAILIEELDAAVKRVAETY